MPYSSLSPNISPKKRRKSASGPPEEEGRGTKKKKEKKKGSWAPLAFSIDRLRRGGKKRENGRVASGKEKRGKMSIDLILQYHHHLVHAPPTRGKKKRKRLQPELWAAREKRKGGKKRGKRPRLCTRL